MKSIKRQFLFLTLLLAAMLLTACTTTAERRQMAALMAEADSMNRNYITFTTDSVMRRVTRFYDRHGTPNEQLHAYYLLGSVYRDLGEAPQALAAFQEAIDRADTTAKDCDYKLLAKVHGQMGALFQQQALYRNAIAEYHQVERYALIAGDTLNAILGYGHTASCYYNLGIEDTTLLISQQTRQRLMAIGKEESANTFLSHPIYIHLSKGRYDDAKTLIDQYEYHSTLSGRDTFAYKNYYLLYYYKGLYHLGTNRLDSASACFRKLAVEGATINNKGLGYSGLFDVYKRQNEKDSIVKYAELYKNCVDSVLKVAEQSRLQSIQGLYNYTRQQQIASSESRRAIKLLYGLIVSFLLVIIAIVSAFLVIMRIRVASRKRLQHLTNEYVFTLMDYGRLKGEIQLLEQNGAQADYQLGSLKEQYETLAAEFKLAKSLLAEMQEDKMSPDTWDLNDSMLTTGIVRKFHKMASQVAVVSDDDWNSLRVAVNKEMPNFMNTIRNFKYQLNRSETNLCILIRLRFIPSEICVLLNTKKNNLSNIRKRLLKRVFEIDGSSKDFDERISEIPR